MDELNAILKHRVNEVLARCGGSQVNWNQGSIPSLEAMCRSVIGEQTPTQELCMLAVMINEDEPSNRKSD